MYYTQYGQERGHHAHRNLRQIIVCLHGSCVCVLDDGEVREEFSLDSPGKGLYIGNWVWRELKKMSKDCVVMVLADNYYNEGDYIRSYECFLEEVKRDKRI